MPSPAPELALFPGLKAFAAANPGFDILTADLLDKDAVTALHWHGTAPATPAALRRAQRVLRIEPDPRAAARLVELGFDSAHAIAGRARSRFVATAAPVLAGGVAQATRIHAAAMGVRTRATHLTANAHALVASRHFTAMAVNHVGPSVTDPFSTLASYADMFGSLDHCDCAECGSILGPAAFLVDLLRIIDLAITQPNTIAAGRSFDERRPDIRALLLTCAATTDEVPYLQIVNAALGRTVAGQLGIAHGDDEAVGLALATAAYPSGLPFNLQLTRIRRYLAARGTSLGDICSVYAPMQSMLMRQRSRERLGLTVEAFTRLLPAKDAAATETAVQEAYALPVTRSPLDLRGLDRLDVFAARTGLAATEVEALLTQGLGPEEVLDASGRYVVSAGSAKGTAITLRQQGSTVEGAYDLDGGTVRGVVTGLTVHGTWHENSGAGSFTLARSRDGASFAGTWSGATGSATAWTGTRDPSTPSTAGLVPHALFINRTLPGRGYLHLQDGTDPTGPFVGIAGQSVESLDAVNRFVRLGRTLGWSWVDLDWTLTTLAPPGVNGVGTIGSGVDLDGPDLWGLGRVVELVERHGLPLDLVNVLWFDLKTTGRGDGEVSAAPFDMIFNTPAAGAARGVYRPRIAQSSTSFPHPLFTDAPLSWQVGAPSPIVAAVPGSGSDVLEVAVALYGAGATITLDVPTLSALHRHTALAAHLGLTIASYIELCTLLDLVSNGMLLNTLPSEKAIKLVDAAQWLTGSGLAVGDVAGIVDGRYDPTPVAGFLAAFADAVAPALVTRATLVSPLVSEAAATAALQVLSNAGHIDPFGVVVGDPSAAAPSLDALADHAPDVGDLSAAQRADIGSSIAAAQRHQADLLGSQVAALLGIPAAQVGTRLGGAADWQRMRAARRAPGTVPVGAFLRASLFGAPPAAVLADGALDPGKVVSAFALQGITLDPATTVVAALSVPAWHVDATVNGTPTRWRVVLRDAGDVAFFPVASGGAPVAPLFTATSSSVTTAGALDVAKVTAVLAGHGGPPAAVTVAAVVTPAAWTVTDRAAGRSYGATQPDGPTGDVLFTGPAAAGPVPPAVVALLTTLSRLSRLQSRLALRDAALDAFLVVPFAFDVGSDAEGLRLGFATVRAAHRYGELVDAFGDGQDRLARYLVDGRRVIEDLCAVTGWDAAETTDLYQALGLTTQTETVGTIAALHEVATIAATVGVQPRDLTALVAATDAAATSAGWTGMAAVADGLLAALHSTTPPAAWPATIQAIEAPTLEAHRDALAAVAVWKLGDSQTDVTTVSSLSDHLLLTVDIGGRAMISPVREALDAAQLYLQRCRLNLEPSAVVSTDDLPDTWWAWLLDYRVWQANRKIFLYPENYLDPTLRRDRTAVFADLQNGLLQGPMTPDSVDAAFRRYLDAFAEIASLEHVDAYHASVHDGDKGLVETLFLFGRTATQPYRFYLASRAAMAGDDASGHQWSEWSPIDVAINAPLVTPVHVFGKLFVLWVELTTKAEQDSTQGTTVRREVTLASVKLSYRGPSGQWMQPQTIVADRVVDVVAGTDLHGDFGALYGDRDALWWTKVDAFRVPATDQHGERLCVFLGPLFDAVMNRSGTTPAPTGDGDAREFAETIAGASIIRNQLDWYGYTGTTPVVPAIVLDANLDSAAIGFDNQHVVAEPDVRAATSAPTFRPALVGSALVVAADRHTVLNDHVTGSTVVTSAVVPANSPLTADSFQSDIVGNQIAPGFFAALTGTLGLIDAAGHVQAQADQQATVAWLETSLTAASGWCSTPVAREVREVLLTALHGAPRLFADASTRTGAVLAARNQPGTFLFRSGSETFLVEASSPAGARFPMGDTAMVEVPPLNRTDTFVGREAFVTRDITLRQSRAFFDALVAASVVYVDGRVQLGTPSGVDVAQIATLLGTDLGRAQQVWAVLTSSYGPAGLAYATTNFVADDTVFTLRFTATRLSTSAVPRLSGVLYAGGVAAMLALPMQQAPLAPRLPFTALGPTTATVAGTGAPLLAPPAMGNGDQVDFTGPYGRYFWELFFHAPLLVATILRGQQQFAAAQSWLRRIFDPTQPGFTPARLAALLPPDIDPARAQPIHAALQPTWVDGDAVTAAALTADPAAIATATGTTPAQAAQLQVLLANTYVERPTARYWQFAPFRTHRLRGLRDQLQDAAAVVAYEDEPFDPDAVARLRIGAYEKAVVMAYVGNLLDWGDQEFGRYTAESVTTARMLYSYAADLLGPRPADLGARRTEGPVAFADVLARYGQDPAKVPAFLIDMENALGGPQAVGPALTSAGRAFNDVGGVFCVPENDRLPALWDRVEDRLFKIRNSLDLAGRAEPLALWDPPIDPAALVAAAAAGGATAGVAAQLRPAVPSHRFAVLVERAVATTEAVRSYGAALLGAIERRDAEQLMLVRAGQETSVLRMVTATRQSAIDDLQAEIAALEQGKAAADHRVTYYAGLLAAGLNPAELSHLSLTDRSIMAKAASLPFHGLSIAGYLAPNIFGLADGGMRFGDAINAGAAIATTASEMLGQMASVADVVGAQLRRADEWRLQQRLGQYEADGLAQQITAATARLAAATQGLAANRQEIADAAQLEALTRARFTNQELYAWMVGRIATVHFQAFRLAQQLALQAQAAYRFELDRDDDIVALGSWDTLHEGLLAGDSLLLSIEQLRQSYLDHDDRRLEIEKTVSLRQAFPLAFTGFRWGTATSGPGQLDFVLGQALYDFDYPSHHSRKIKSISVTVPSVIGPYQDLHLTLTQNTNLVVVEPDDGAVDYAIARTTASPSSPLPVPLPGSVRENWTPSQTIAVSRGTDDAGLFTLDFHDERYLPFEGTGAVSSWTLSLPPETNRIDYDAIADVVLKVRYTARDGGPVFGAKVKRLYAQAGDRFAYLNAASLHLAQAFGGPWAELFATPPVAGIQTITFRVPGGAVLPGVAGVRLAGVAVRLETAGSGGVSSAAGTPFLALRIDGTPATPVGIPVTAGAGEVAAADLPGLPNAFSPATWTLTFDTRLAPSDLLTNGALDPAKLLDVAVVVAYTATPFGSA